MADLADFKNEIYLKNFDKLFRKNEFKKISLIRLACNYQDKDILESVIKKLKAKNFQIAVNLMKFTILKVYLEVNRFPNV